MILGIGGQNGLNQGRKTLGVSMVFSVISSRHIGHHQIKQYILIKGPL